MGWGESVTPNWRRRRKELGIDKIMMSRWLYVGARSRGVGSVHKPLWLTLSFTCAHSRSFWSPWSCSPVPAPARADPFVCIHRPPAILVLPRLYFIRAHTHSYLIHTLARPYLVHTLTRSFLVRTSFAPSLVRAPTCS